MLPWLDIVIGWPGLLVIAGAMSVGAALQGAVGFGMALLVSPILVLIEPRLIPGPFLVAAQLLSILMIMREREAIDLRGLKWAIVGRLPGTILAGYLLATISEPALILTFGFLILLAVAISVSGVRFPPRPGNLFVAGILSGVMGTIATIGGPPMAIVYQDAPEAEFRSTLSGYFILVGIFALVTLVAVGRFGMLELKLSALLIPGVLVGFLLSSRLLPYLNPKVTRTMVLTIATVSAVVVILRQLI